MIWWLSRPRLNVLVVCTANICRSPMAEGILRRELTSLGLHRQVRVQSAGTHAAQVGRAADPRAVAVCRDHAVPIHRSRARQVQEQDFRRFDHILAMDDKNYQWLIEAVPPDNRARVLKVGEWSESGDLVEILDPYYGNNSGFELVFEQLALHMAQFAQYLSKEL